MYTTKNRLNRNNACTPPTMVCKSSHSVQTVVGARGYRNGREPFHVCKMSWRCNVQRRENLVNRLAWHFEDHSNLRYLMTCITVKWNDTLYKQNSPLLPCMT